MTTATGSAKPPKFPLEKLINSPNIAEFLPEQYRADLGKQVVLDMARDKASRADWEERHAKAIKLALQVKEAKSFPWTNCSNVKFPLLTIAVLQFLARISIMTKGQNIAKVNVIGNDTTGEKYYQSKRMSKHLSLQLVDEDVNWRDSDEQAKFSACLVGSAFKKTYPDLVQGKNISEHVPSMDLIIDYKCKDIDKAQRITHIIPMTGNDIQENVRRGLFCELTNTVDPTLPSEHYLLQQTEQETTGIRPTGGDTNDTYEILEQQLWIDLDGDGYREPYVASVRHDTQQLLRLVARFTDAGRVHRVNDQMVKQLEQYALHEEDLKKKSDFEKKAHALHTAANNHIVRITPMLYYTRLLFIPSPDGGVYGLGLGALLGPLNETVDTLINQLIDGGTMANSAGGFLGRGVKIKGGKTSFDPFEWKPVDSTGTDLKNNIVPLPVREPSAVLFQLLGTLVQYAEKLSGATDIMTGVTPGQNTPAETSRNTVEQGMMLFSGIYARMYRGFTEELNKILELNKLFLPKYASFSELTTGPDAIIYPDDYTKNTSRVFPAASPEAVSTSQRREKASVVLQLAEREPGFNKYLCVLDFLEAYDVEDIDNKYPDPRGQKAIPPVPNPKMVELDLKKQIHQDNMQLAVATLKQDMSLVEARIAELHAKATKELAEAQGVDTGHQIALINSRIAAEKNHKEGLLAALAVLQKSAESGGKLQLEHQKQQHEQQKSTEGAIGNGDTGGGAA
jgi:hypothetical protein